MPEVRGAVTELIKKGDGTVFGLKVAGDEYLYSFPNKRATPFEEDKVQVGSFVRIEYADYTRDGKTKHYAAVLECTPDSLVEFSESPETPPVAREWGYEQRDRLMARESCVKSACNMIAAAIEAGIYKPDVEEQRFSRTVTALSEALERWVLGALDGTD